MTDELWWYVIRGSGLAAWSLLAADVLIGLAMSTGWIPVRRARPLHTWIGGLAVTALGLHLASLAADSFMTFSLTDLLVPFASDWSAGAVAWGVGAMYLLLAVEVSSLLRSRVPTQVWRVVHLGSFLAFWLATMHAVTAGTDLGVPAVAGVVAGTVVGVLGLLLLRIWQAAVPGSRAALARRRQSRRIVPANSGEVRHAPPERNTSAATSRVCSRPASPATARTSVAASAHRPDVATTDAAAAPVVVGRPVDGSTSWWTSGQSTAPARPGDGCPAPVCSPLPDELRASDPSRSKLRS